MASTWPSLLFHLIHISVIMSLLLVTTQAETPISLGSYLYANDDNIAWNSSSGDFAFGFRKYPNQADQFFLAIWFAKIPDKTVVWSANASNPAPKGSKLELTTSGLLMLTSPGGGKIWSTTNIGFIEPSQAAMLETGNFVIRGNSSSIIIWESFRNPTNTILPTQVLNIGDKLSAGEIFGGSFSSGKLNI